MEHPSETSRTPELNDGKITLESPAAWIDQVSCGDSQEWTK